MTEEQQLFVGQFEALLERAMIAEHGITATFKDYSEARRMRYRIYEFVRQHRKKSKKVFPEDDARYGLSPYDVVVIYLPKAGQPNDNVLTLKKTTPTFTVEDIK